MQEKVRKVLEKNKKMLISGGITSIEVVSVSPEGVVTLRYTGPCGHDSMSNVVTISVIEGKIKQEIPEVKAVKAAWFWPNKK